MIIIFQRGRTQGTQKWAETKTTEIETGMALCEIVNRKQIVTYSEKVSTKWCSQGKDHRRTITNNEIDRVCWKAKFIMASIMTITPMIVEDVR